MNTTEMDGLIVVEPSNSSNIKRFAYRLADDVLLVEFKDGAKYQYDGVSLQIFDEMVHAKSVGCFFHSRVKNNYESQRILDF